MIKHSDDRLEIVHPYGSIDLARLSAERASGMAAVLANAPDTEQTCARALRCCEEATEALDQRCSREQELGDGRWLRQCLNTIDGFRELLVAAGKDVPESCAPLPSADTALDGGVE